MKIRTKFENTKCRICGTHIPQWEECIWTEGKQGVTCVNPCTPRVTPKKPRKNVPQSTPAQTRAIPVSTKHTLTVDQAGAIRESLVNLDNDSLRLIQSLIDDLLSDDMCSPENSMRALPEPTVTPSKAPFPAPPQAGDQHAYHCECHICGHIWDTRAGKPDRCNWCEATPLAIADKLGGCFNPIETHSCGQWAFHDPDNADHKRNCTQCQLTPHIHTDLSIPVNPSAKPDPRWAVKADRIVRIGNKPVVDSPRKPKFSF